MFMPFSPRLLFRVCLPMVSWVELVPPATESTGPDLLSRTADQVPDHINRLMQEAQADADVYGGSQWDLARVGIVTPDLCPRYDDGNFSVGIDFGADGGMEFLLEEKRATDIARFGGRNGAGARLLSRAEKVSKIDTVDPDTPGRRWLRISRVELASLDAIGWKTVGMAPRTEQLALCFIGLLGIVHSILRRRGQMGGKPVGRHRSTRLRRYRID